MDAALVGLIVFFAFISGAIVALVAAKQFSRPPTDPLPAVMEMFRTMYGDRTVDQENDTRLIAAQQELSSLLSLPEPPQEQWIDPTAGFQPEHSDFAWVTPGEDPFEGLNGTPIHDFDDAT